MVWWKPNFIQGEYLKGDECRAVDGSIDDVVAENTGSHTPFVLAWPLVLHQSNGMEQEKSKSIDQTEKGGCEQANARWVGPHFNL